MARTRTIKPQHCHCYKLFPWIACALVFIRCLPTSDLATDTDCDTIMTFRTFENVSRESGLFYF